MGSCLAIAERWLSLCESAGNSGAPNRIRLDEERSYLGSSGTTNCRITGSSAQGIPARQRLLLARLIGGESRQAESLSACLISTFGSLGGVLSARPAALSRVIDDPQLVSRISITRDAVLEGLSESLQRGRFDISDANVQRWIVSLFNGLRRERIHIVLLDRDQRIITDMQVADGDMDSVAGSLREIARCGIETDASGVVLMHNHPSGDVRPSESDVSETRKIASLLASLDLILEDHLIVSGGSIFSMREAMLI